MKTNQVKLRKLLRKYIDSKEAAMSKAFLLSVSELANEASIAQMAKAIAENNVDGVIAALHLENAAFDPMFRTYRQLFEEAGVITLSALPKKMPRKR